VTSDAGDFDPCEFRRLQESSAMHGLVASAHCSCGEVGHVLCAAGLLLGVPTHCVPTTLPPLSAEASLRPGPASADPSDLDSSTACAIEGATATQTSSNKRSNLFGRIMKILIFDDDQDLTSSIVCQF
jgi:hypothetical protein